MKRFIILFALLFGVGLLNTQPASAHELKTNGSMGILLHIDPNDSPMAGEPIHYILLFNDKSNQFKLADCVCRMTLKSNNSIIQTASLDALRKYSSEGNLTFPRPEVYELVVSGHPKSPGAFKPFVISFDVRVEDKSAAAQHNKIPMLLILGIEAAVLLVLLAAYRIVHNILEGED